MVGPRTLLLALLLSSGTPALASSASPPALAGEVYAASTARLEGVIRLVERLPTGRALLERARSLWGASRPRDLFEHLAWGPQSRTDAVLTRHLDAASGAERRERQVRVFLRPDQHLETLALDLVHELTHATTDPGWDPYDPALTPGRYIWSAIEGPGGEVDALVSECAAARELAQLVGGTASARCQPYFTQSSRGPGLDREAIRRDFYRVGGWAAGLRKRLGTETSLFPLLSTGRAVLHSSTGQSPYPIALLREYGEMNSVACENSRRRVEPGASRAPAATANPEAERVAAARIFMRARCVDGTETRTHQSSPR